MPHQRTPSYPTESLAVVALLVLASLAPLAGCRPAVEPPPGWINEARLFNGASEPDNWLSLGGNYLQQHYSPLAKIDASNVDDLGFAWEYDARSRIGRVPRGLEATPFVVDGVMYTSGAWGVVYALDAATGEERWRYDPPVDASYARRACCDVVNRGVAVWKGSVYVGTLDGYLVRLSADTGEELWRVDTFTDRTVAYTITGPPQVAGGVVVIGNSGAEFGVRGYITAYDLETGDQAWRFFTVPGDPDKGFEHPEMEMAAATWDPDSHWEAGGGGTVWGEFAYDPELNLLYVGTGNSSPYPIWFRSPAGGDNLFLCSILAINPDTGRLVWHYQAVPGEIWDYTNTMNLVLADLEIDGEPRRVIMQAPKNGFFYVLDRATGELLSAEPFTAVNWASHVDLETGRPVLTRQGWYRDEPKLVVPSLTGGHSWQPMSYNPHTGLVYIPEIVAPFIYQSQDTYTFRKIKFGTGLIYDNCCYPFPASMQRYLEGQQHTVPKNFLTAWDPVRQEAVWRVEHPVQRGNGGLLSTGGNLVFQGTNTGHLKVFAATTGELLHEIDTGTAIMAAPATYIVNGEQYVAVMAGFGGQYLGFSTTDERAAYHRYQNYGRILAFKLGGGTTPLPPEVTPMTVVAPPDAALNPTLIARGEEVYTDFCVSCHVVGASSDRFSHFPNLGNLAPATHEAFNAIVLDGALAANGMAGFADVLSEADVEALHQYLIAEQKTWWEEVQGTR